MPVLLQVLGGLISLSGLVVVGFGLPIRYASLDNTMIAAGISALVGGLLLIGLGSALRELRKLHKAIERAGLPARAEEAPVMPARSPRVTGPLPTPPIPPAAPVRAEPRLEPAMPEAEEEAQEPSFEPAAAAASEPARQRPSIFALVRGAKTEHYEIEETESVPLSPAAPPRMPPQPAMPERVALNTEPMFEPRMPEPRYAEPRPEPRSERSESRAMSPATLASRTAARIDLPRPVPELPRANERGGRNLFDTVWPNEQKPEPAPERPIFGAPPPRAPSPSERMASERLTSAERLMPERPLFVPELEPARDAGDIAHAAVREAFESLSLGGEPEEAPPARQEPKLDIPKPITILKSGVIDGMAYTLYTDGSIEAQLPSGLMRFASIDDLRSYLERSSG